MNESRAKEKHSTKAVCTFLKGDMGVTGYLSRRGLGRLVLCAQIVDTCCLIVHNKFIDLAHPWGLEVDLKVDESLVFDTSPFQMFRSLTFI